MNEMTSNRPTASPAHGMVWLIAGAAAAFVATHALIVAIGGGAIMIAALLGADRASGVVFYAFALAAMVASYWALIHVSMQALSSHVEIPWPVWVGMAIPPLAWFFTSLSDPAFAPTPTIVGLLGVAGAWFTLGGAAWSRP